MIFLPNVTLLAVTSVNLQQTVNALLISSERIEFGAIKLLSSVCVDDLPKKIQHVEIPSMDIFGYSKFMIEKLHEFVDTDYCLVVQPDGFVINPKMWDAQYLAYDYIGAPWPALLHSSVGDLAMKNRVGNGGFSLRSKRFLNATASLNFDEIVTPIKSEDMLACHYFYDHMVENGVVFAPLEVAEKFSMEARLEEGKTLTSVFGFHGKSWLKLEHLGWFQEKTELKAELSSLISM